MVSKYVCVCAYISVYVLYICIYNIYSYVKMHFIYESFSMLPV